MDLITVSAPAAEPVSLDEAKAHLRVDHSDEDALITATIKRAREAVESFTRLRLITQTVRFSVDGFPPAIAIPAWPVQSVASVVYDDAAGVEQTLAADQYRLVDSAKPRVIEPAYGVDWPETRGHRASVRVTCVVGFGDTGADVPGDLIAALMLRVGSLYERREPEIIGASVAPIPMDERALMLPHVLY